MQLRLKIGRYAGEIREFPFDVGRGLLENGSAEDPYAEPIAPPPVQLEAPRIPQVPPAPRSRKMGRGEAAVGPTAGGAK